MEHAPPLCKCVVLRFRRHHALKSAMKRKKKELRIELFDAVSGGALKCTVTQTVALTNERFQIALSDTFAEAIAASADL